MVYYYLSETTLHTAMWRNWQTRATQNRVSTEVWVRLPPSPPFSRLNTPFTNDEVFLFYIESEKIMNLTIMYDTDDHGETYVQVYNTGELVSQVHVSMIGKDAIYPSITNFISQQRTLFLQQSEGFPSRIFIEEAIQVDIDCEKANGH